MTKSAQTKKIKIEIKQKYVNETTIVNILKGAKSHWQIFVKITVFVVILQQQILKSFK